MGVKGLMRYLQPMIELVDIRTVSGQTAAIDIKGWLYRSLSTTLCRGDE
jgi:hypothetical protein